MNHHQIDKANMYQATNLVLNEPANQTIWSSLAAFVRGQTAHEGSINIISALAQAQGSPLTGIASDKDRLRTSLINRTLIVAGAAGSYAFEEQNQTLAAKFDVTVSSLANLRDIMIDDTAQLIHDEANTLVTADPVKMTDYNLTPAMLTDLQTAITAYGATVGTPRAAISDRTAITEAIANEITRADANLENILDRLILQFQADHPLFVTAYHSARNIVQTGHHKTQDPTPPAP